MQPADSSTEDTLDLKLPAEVIALFAATPDPPTDGGDAAEDADTAEGSGGGGGGGDEAAPGAGAGQGAAVLRRAGREAAQGPGLAPDLAAAANTGPAASPAAAGVAAAAKATPAPGTGAAVGLAANAAPAPDVAAAVRPVPATGLAPPPPAGPPTDVAPPPPVGRVTAPAPVPDLAPPAAAVRVADLAPAAGRPVARQPSPADCSDLLDRLADWPATRTGAGLFRLVPVDPGRDLALVSRWMNDPAVAEFWQLDGEPEVTARHLAAQLDGDGRSVPCLGVLDGVPMSYWEVYRADLDPIARFYPARPHDTGVHLLVGGVADRARGLGGVLLRAVCDLVLDNRPGCTRVVAEPDLRNTPSVAAFLSAGFRFCLELKLPDKRAALMVRDRALRNRL